MSGDHRRTAVARAIAEERSTSAFPEPIEDAGRRRVDIHDMMRCA